MEMPFVLWCAKYTALQKCCCSYSYLSDSTEMDQVQILTQRHEDKQASTGAGLLGEMLPL